MVRLVLTALVSTAVTVACAKVTLPSTTPQENPQHSSDSLELSPDVQDSGPDTPVPQCRLDKDCPAPKNPCQVSRCNTATNTCQVETLPKDTPCDDQEPCTENDRCTTEGTCAGDFKCNDEDPCTEDICEKYDPNMAVCYHRPIPECKKCSDPQDCAVENSCVTARCVGGICQYEMVQDGAACKHEDPCVLVAVCDGALCKPLKTLNCDDGNPCTTDKCEAGQCISTPVEWQTCNDNNPCTQKDFCQNGKCVGEPVSCEDNLKCTDDFCVSSLVSPGSALCPEDATLDCTADVGYCCCHVNLCEQPNPDCTPKGCMCGSIYCDPKTSDNCAVSEPTLGPTPCRCGPNLPCPAGQCCVKGSCSQVCPIPQRRQ